MNICYFFVQRRKCWYQIKGMDKFLRQVFQLQKVISASAIHVKVSCIFFSEKFFIDLIQKFLFNNKAEDTEEELV